MAKTRRARAAYIPGEAPTIEQQRNGTYERAAVMHAETATIASAYRASNILDKWLLEGEPFFPDRACKVIREMETLWHRMGEPRVSARYGEWLPPSTGDGMNAHDASSQIEYMLADIERPFRVVFENVVRWRQPAGTAGSDIADNTAAQIQAAKCVTSEVARNVAKRLKY